MDRFPPEALGRKPAVPPLCRKHEICTRSQTSCYQRVSACIYRVRNPSRPSQLTLTPISRPTPNVTAAAA
jgi:hypothetical protein